jgi:hypothetical protein
MNTTIPSNTQPALEASSIIIKFVYWWGSALALVATATVFTVWFYHAPAIATLESQVITVIDDIRYIRDRVDDIYNRLPAKM